MGGVFMNDQNFQNLSKEEQILLAVKKVLTEVVKDTATPPGMKHPLSESTINGMRDCLALISGRERELAEAAGRSMDQRPHFTDEPKPQGDVVVPLKNIGKSDKSKG
jgi:hypothetical protein